MKWKGIELKKITEPQIYDPPKKMVVWNTQCNKIEERTVYAIVKDAKGDTWAITHPCFIGDILEYWAYCAEIPEETKPRRATNRELAKWLAQGNGEVQDKSSLYCTFISFNYGPKLEDNPVIEYYKVRKWDDTEWHEPTVDYLGIKEAE